MTKAVTSRKYLVRYWVKFVLALGFSLGLGAISEPKLSAAEVFLVYAAMRLLMELPTND